MQSFLLSQHCSSEPSLRPKSKVCTGCKRDLLLDDFSAHKGGKYGKHSRCRGCDSAYQKAHLSDPKNYKRRKETHARWHKENKDRLAAVRAESYRNRRSRHLAWMAACRAKKKGIPYTLTDADVAEIQKRIDAGRCEMTGTPFDLSGKKTFNSPSIDRIDSTGGYTMDNIRIVCHAMNAAMGTWGEGPVWEMFQNWLMVAPARKRRGRKCSVASATQ